MSILDFTTGKTIVIKVDYKQLHSEYFQHYNTQPIDSTEVYEYFIENTLNVTPSNYHFMISEVLDLEIKC